MFDGAKPSRTIRSSTESSASKWPSMFKSTNRFGVDSKVRRAQKFEDLIQRSKTSR